MEGLLCSLMLCHGFGGIRLFKYLASLALSRRNYLPFKCVAHAVFDPYVRNAPQILQPSIAVSGLSSSCVYR